jgi:hypothetical protein
MALIAHGGAVGLVIEIVPALLLVALGLSVWLRDRRRSSASARPGDEAGVEEGGGDGE